MDATGQGDASHGVSISIQQGTTATLKFGHNKQELNNPN